jgi:hypothetical protein
MLTRVPNQHHHYIGKHCNLSVPDAGHRAITLPIMLRLRRSSRHETVAMSRLRRSSRYNVAEHVTLAAFVQFDCG